MTTMTKRERLERTARGEPVDRPAVALWRHWPVDDRDAAALALAHVTFQQQFDFDLIKVTPSSSYCLEEWGVEDVYRGSEEGTFDYVRHPIQRTEDWARLEVLDPREGGLGRQLECLALIREQVGDEVPFIQTIFNPLSQVKNLVGGDQVGVHIRRHPEALVGALETITATTVAFVREALQTGAAGVFFAVQHASYALLSEEEYRIFGRPYDLQVLEAAGAGWFNLLHLHGDEVMFDLLSDYPVQAINWHDRETPPSLAEGLERFTGAVCGGLRQWETMVRGNPKAVRAEALDALEQTGGRRFILGTGCVTPIVAPTVNIRAARQVVEG